MQAGTRPQSTAADRQIRALVAVVVCLALVTLAGCEQRPEPATQAALADSAALSPANAPSATSTETTPAPDAEPPSRRVFDVHVHLNARGAALALDFFQANGIRRVANLSGGNQAKRYEQSLALIKASDGAIVPFFNIDWSRLETEGDQFGVAIAADLAQAVAAGYGGLKISKALGLSVEDTAGNRLPVDSPLLDPIFEKAGELGVPVSIHTGDPKAFFEPLNEQNERYKELSANPSWSFAGDAFPSREELLAERDRRLARHPKTTFICVHFGNNPEDVDYVDALLDTYPNAMLDISARLGEIGRHDPAKVRAIFIKHRGRILFGTDSMFFGSPRGFSVTLGSFSDRPLTADDVGAFFDAHWRFLESHDAAMPNPVPIQGEWEIYPIGLPADVLEDVYWRNAERLIFGPWDARHAAMLMQRPGAPPTPPPPPPAPPTRAP